MITTNIEVRSERASDREILIVFDIPTASQEEMSMAEKKYDKAMHSKKIPIGSTIKYGQFIISSGIY